MTLRKPIIIVQGPRTANLLSVWGDTLVGIQIHDATANDSDSCTLTFRVAPPFPALPPQGTRYVVKVGWSADALGMTGIYTVQRVTLEGDPESGHLMRVVCRAADLADGAKSADSKHWDDKTLGEIVDDVAGSMGRPAVVDPDLRSIKIPYRARLNQSPGDFLSDLADDFGGAFKDAGDKVVMTQRGSGRSATGQPLPTITFAYERTYDFSFDFEPRGADEEAGLMWWNPDKGRWETERDEGAGKGRLLPPRPRPSKDEARRGAAAARKEHQRQSASGSVSGPGNPLAVAGCPVTVTGFGPDADGTEWIAESIDHDIDPAGGWIMTVNLETRDKADE